MTGAGNCKLTEGKLPKLAVQTARAYYYTLRTELFQNINVFDIPIQESNFKKPDSPVSFFMSPTD